MIDFASPSQDVLVSVAEQVRLYPLQIAISRTDGTVEVLAADATGEVSLSGASATSVVITNTDTIAHLVNVDVNRLGSVAPINSTRLNPGERLEYFAGVWTKYDNEGEITVQYYTTRLDEGATYTYIGKAEPGSSESDEVWQIQRMTNATTTILFADGNANFDNIWSNRASLSYS